MLRKTATLVAVVGLTFGPSGCQRPASRPHANHSTATPAATAAPLRADAATQAAADIIVQALIQPQGAVGYGQLFDAVPQKVFKGTLHTATLRLTVLASDAVTETALRSIPPGDIVELGFKKSRDHEPYALMPLTGFVDDTMTSWTLVYTR